MRYLLVLLATLIIFSGCDKKSDDNSASGSDKQESNATNIPKDTSISLAGISIEASGNTVVDEINFARKALALGGEDAKNYYDKVIVPNAMSNADMPQRLAEVKEIFYGNLSLIANGKNTTQTELRAMKILTNNSAISSDIDNYAVNNHDISQWKQGENAEVAWFTDLSKFPETKDERARGAVVNWITDPGNSPNFGHRGAVLDPTYTSGGATSDVTNTMEGKPNIKSGGHVVARMKI